MLTGLMKESERKRRGAPLVFTLIELLTVVAIMSALASLLLPALQKSRDAANRTICVNKERSIMQECFMYLSDSNDQWFPCSAPSMWFQDGSKFASEYLGVRWNASGDYWRNTVLNCRAKGFQEGYNHVSMDYVLNASLTDQTSRGWKGLCSRVKLPSKTPVFGECIRYSENNGNTYFFSCWAWSPADGYSPFEWTTHLNKDNFAFVDGHVASHAVQQRMDKTVFIWDARQEQ